MKNADEVVDEFRRHLDNPEVYSGKMMDEIDFRPIDGTFSKFTNNVVDESILIEKRGYV